MPCAVNPSAGWGDGYDWRSVHSHCYCACVGGGVVVCDGGTDDVGVRNYRDDDFQTSGNLVSSKTIIDDCYPTSDSYMGHDAAAGHYWYIKGEIYVYDLYLSAYTGAAAAYSKTVSIPLTITAGSHGTVVRGMNGTTRATHLANATIYNCGIVDITPISHPVFVRVTPPSGLPTQKSRSIYVVVQSDEEVY